MKVLINKTNNEVIERILGAEEKELIEHASILNIKEFELIEMDFNLYVEKLKVQEFNNSSYQEKRRREYPSQNDYLDAKVKQGSPDILIKQEGIKQEQDYINKCLAVKEKYPKA